MNVLIGQCDLLRICLKKLALESRSEEGAQAQNILVGCEHALLWSYQQSDDGTSQGTTENEGISVLLCYVVFFR